MIEQLFRSVKRCNNLFTGLKVFHAEFKVRVFTFLSEVSCLNFAHFPSYVISPLIILVICHCQSVILLIALFFVIQILLSYSNENTVY